MKRSRSVRRASGTLWRLGLAVPCCLLFGGIAQAQVCPVTGNPLPNGGGTPQPNGTPSQLQRTGGGNGQFGAQGALQLVNLAQQAMQIQKLIQYQQPSPGVRQRPLQLTQPITKPLKTARLKRSEYSPIIKDKSRPLSRRDKLIARLKQRKLDRQQKAEQARARRKAAK